MYVVTIDGPAGVGKSTLAKKVAGYLKIAYLDTGAMFRTIALGLGEDDIKNKPDNLFDNLRDRFSFSLLGSGNDTKLLCNNKIVGEEIRAEEVASLAASIATEPKVRDFLKCVQQNLGSTYSLVAEGRDMGTVVFPAARMKFFLDADPKIRAKRRFDQLKSQGKRVDINIITEQVIERDIHDRTRAVAPLRPADDSIIIDTSNMTLEEVFNSMIMFCYQKKLISSLTA